MTIIGRSRRVLSVGLLLAAAAPLASCMATVGVNSMSIPRNAAQTCDRHCQTIGMRLSAVAIMAENVGCVCQFVPQPQASAGEAGELATPIAGMATIVLQAAAARQQQQQQQRHM
jgi:hypothetical protein